LKNNKKKAKKYLELIEERYSRLEVNGTSDGKPKFDSIRKSSPKLEEIRFSFENMEHRIFISLIKEENKYIILHYLYGKDVQKTPRRDIDIAEERMSQYLNQRRES